MARSVSGKISPTSVRQLEPGDELRDAELKGFGARRQLSAITYFVHTRIRGRLRRLTIGRHGSPWTPETARREASRLLLSIRTGQDPASERDQERARLMFDQVADRFLDVHGAKLKPRTREEYARLIRIQLKPAFRNRGLDDIDVAAVEKAHAAWSETPRAGNHALAVLSKLLSWAEEHRYRTAGENPCFKIERYRENKRERYLTADELVELGAALDAAEAAGENPFIIALVRLLVLTGARLSELLTLKWAYVDEQRRMLRLPDSKTGAKTIILSEPALLVLNAIPRLAGNPYVLPGRREGEHLVSVKRTWQQIRKTAGLEDVRLHDLRHSFASVAIDAGGSLPVIGRLLGHSQPATTARYAHVAPSPARELADAVGARISAAWLPKTVKTNDETESDAS